MDINEVKLVYSSQKEKEFKEVLIYLIKLQDFSNNYNFGIEKDIEYYYNRLKNLRG